MYYDKKMLRKSYDKKMIRKTFDAGQKVIYESKLPLEP